MNRKNQIFLVTLLGLILSFVGCQNGLTPERIPFENQEGLKRHLPKIEVTSEDRKRNEESKEKRRKKDAKNWKVRINLGKGSQRDRRSNTE